MTAGRFGARVKKECEAWARTFALELPIVEEAVDGYLAILAEGAGEAPLDADVAKTLSRLRKDVGRIITGPGADVEAHAKHLEEITARLDRSIAHAELLEIAGLAEGLPGLRDRLRATRALVTAIRAAIARRAKPR